MKFSLMIMALMFSSAIAADRPEEKNLAQVMDGESIILSLGYEPNTHNKFVKVLTENEEVYYCTAPEDNSVVSEYICTKKEDN